MRSCRGVTAITSPPVLLPMVRHTPPSSPSTTTFSPVVSLEYLISSRNNEMATPPYHPSPRPVQDMKQNTVLISAHPTIVHDSSHSCPKCSSSSSTEPKSNYIVSSSLQCDSASLTVQWSIPSSKTDSVVMASNHTIDYIKFPSVDSPDPCVPIFSVSPDLKESALLNMSHTAENHVHVVVTKSSNFSAYHSAWPSHIIAALPDCVFKGTGSCLNAIKALGQWNYLQNAAKSKSVVFPWLLVLGDSVCMVLREAGEKRYVCVCASA